MATIRNWLSNLTTITVLTLAAAGSVSAAESAAQEESLIAILKDKTPAEKALACKQLAVHGTDKAVPELARLLTDEQLASWARIALEAIPGEAADEALCTALDSLRGKLLVGTINSLGVRRAAKAVEPLSGRLSDQDGDVGAAAAVALGRIGGADATKTLLKALTEGPAAIRPAVAEGCILVAEGLQTAGKDAEAAAIYEQVRKAEVPRQRMLEATRGLILARKQEGIPILLEQLRSPDRAIFHIGLSTARELAGQQVDEALAAELGSANPERAPLLIAAMADRSGKVLLPAILKAATKGPKEVRIAAIAALGRVGEASCLSPMLDVALESDAELAAAARKALAELPGTEIDQEIQSRLKNAEGKSLPVLLELVGERRIPATQALLNAVNHQDQAVRRAALVSLGNTIPPENLSQLIAQAVSPKRPEDAAIAQNALKVASVRMPDREACAAELSAAFQKATPATKPVVLEILGAVGGAKALQTLGAAAKSSDPQLQDVSTRLLGEWMTIDAAPVLLDLSQSAPGEKYQSRALRGYLRIARQFLMPDAQRAEMCEKAFATARQPAEQKLVLEIVKRYPKKEMLSLLNKASRIPQLRSETAEVAMLMVPNLEPAQARELLTSVGLDRVKIEIVKAEYGAGSVQKDVTETLRKQAGDIPLITLSAADYNSSFGGDPVPGAVKQLKVQYRINGKGSEKLFPENAPIVLSMPK